MAVRHTVLAVTTTAKSLWGTVTDTGYHPGAEIVAQNNSSAYIYIGGSDVTTSSYGHSIAPGGTVVLDLRRGDTPYAIAGSSVDLHLLFLGVDAS